jgi:hypothetical protein
MNTPEKIVSSPAALRAASNICARHGLSNPATHDWIATMIDAELAAERAELIEALQGFVEDPDSMVAFEKARAVLAKHT